MLSFCEDIYSCKQISWNKKNAKLSNDIVHDLYTYEFFFVAVPLKSKSQINDYPHFNCFSCLYCGIFFFISRIHVIFGHELQGQEIVSEIEIQRIDDKSRPLVDVKIINCGELIPKAQAKGTWYVSID